MEIRSAISKVTEVYPIILFPVGDDIADMEVSVEAGLGGREAVQHRPSAQKKNTGLGPVLDYKNGAIYTGTICKAPSLLRSLVYIR